MLCFVLFLFRFETATRTVGTLAFRQSGSLFCTPIRLPTPTRRSSPLHEPRRGAPISAQGAAKRGTSEAQPWVQNPTETVSPEGTALIEILHLETPKTPIRPCRNVARDERSATMGIDSEMGFANCANDMGSKAMNDSREIETVVVSPRGAPLGLLGECGRVTQGCANARRARFGSTLG